MGLTTALEIESRDIPLEEKVHFHLMTNIFPRPPFSMVEVALKAIYTYLEDKPYGIIELPEGVTFRGDTKTDAVAIIDAYHLEVFIPSDDEEDY